MFSLLSCVETEPGCLDLRSANYDVQAVSDCDDCCEYPGISFKVDFVADTLSSPFKTDIEFNGDSINVSSFELAFSDFEFFENGVVFNSRDSIITHPEEKDDYIIIEENTSKRGLGQSKFLIDLDSFAFTIGYDTDHVRSIDLPENIDEDSQLSILLSRYYVDSTSTYLQGRMELEIGDSLRNLEFTEINNPRKGFSDNLELEIGEGWTVNVKMDLLQILSGIVATNTNEEMQNIISNNISDATFKD